MDRVGAQDELDAIVLSVTIGIFLGAGIGVGRRSEMDDLPFRESHVVDPGGEQGLGGEVALVGGERGHARHPVAPDAAEHHRTGRLAEGGSVVLHEEARERITPMIDERSVDEIGGGQGCGDARVPVSEGRTAGLVAADTVHRKVGARARFEALVGVAGRSVGG